MNESLVHVCIVRTPEGMKHYLTVLQADTVFSKGRIPEAIVGVLLRPLTEGESITPELFARNSIFVKFMHEVIARYAPDQPECRNEAKRLGNGWICVVDQRTKTPGGAVPPEDIIGALQAREGEIVPASYRPSPQHKILSDDGFFRLSPGLYQCLLSALQSRMSA